MSRIIPALALRTAPNATPGPSSIPARFVKGTWRTASTPRHVHHHHHQLACTQIRFESSKSSPASPASPASSASSPSSAVFPHPSPAFDQLVDSLSASQPCFGARGDEIEILGSPVDFYDKLIEMIQRAKRRIIISSLYIGAEEAELVDTIRTSLQAHPQLRVSFILDYHRATRLSNSSQDLPPSTAHLLLPLLEQYPDRCEVWLYRSPKLRGIMERIVPTRYDEGWGTWHAKWYGVDDEVILSGANLAGSYFTNRQDRYIHFRHHPTLLSYLSSLSRLITQYAYRLTPSVAPSFSRHHVVPLPQPPGDAPKFFGSASLSWPTGSLHPRRFSQHALATLTAFQNSWKASNPGRMRRVDVDTYFWPVIQAGVLGIKEEEAALAKVWRAVAAAHDDEDERVTVDLTSGYFGLYKAYKRAVVDSPATYRVIAASPKANGFYGSAGFSRLIPEGYTLLESRFWEDAKAKGRTYQPRTETGVRLKEWEREGWTYHAKGVWVSPSKAPTNPFLTFIGSSNLSTRSLTLDTELSLLLTTSSPSLRRALASEVKALDGYTQDVGAETWALEERKVSTLAKVLVALGVEGML